MDKEKAYKLGVAQNLYRKKYKSERRAAKIREFLIWPCVIIIAVALMILLTLRVSSCYDNAMSPSFDKNDIVITNKTAYFISEPERGDIISFTYKDSTGETVVLQRRVIAFPGETVEIKDGSVYVDGVLCEESYASGITESDIESVTVPESCYYVLSDNRSEGPDSRDGVYATRTSVIGEELAYIDFDIISKLFS